MNKIQKIRLKKIYIIALIVVAFGTIASLSTISIYQKNLMVTAEKIASQTQIYNHLDIPEQPNIYTEFSFRALSTAPEKELFDFNQFAKLTLMAQSADEILVSENQLDITVGGAELDSESDALSSFLSAGAVEPKTLYEAFGDRFALAKITQDGDSYLLVNVKDKKIWDSFSDKIIAKYKVYENVNIVAFSLEKDSNFSDLNFSPNANIKATVANVNAINAIQAKGRYGDKNIEANRGSQLTGVTVGVAYFNLDSISYREGAQGGADAETIGGSLAGVISITATRGTTILFSLDDVTVGDEIYPPAIYTNFSDPDFLLKKHTSATTITETFHDLTSSNYKYTFVIKNGGSFFNQYANTTLFNRAFGIENIVNSLNMNLDAPDIEGAMGPDTIGFSSGSFLDPEFYSIYLTNPNTSTLQQYSNLIEREQALYIVNDKETPKNVTRYSRIMMGNVEPSKPLIGEDDTILTPDGEPTSDDNSESATNNEEMNIMAPSAFEQLNRDDIIKLLNAVDPRVENCDIAGVVDAPYFLFRYLYGDSPAAVAMTENKVLGKIGICQQGKTLSVTLINN